MQQYLDLLRRIVDDGEDVQSGATLVGEGRKPTCRFLLAQQLRFDLRKGFPAVTTKRLLFDWVVDEVIWFLRGNTNINSLGRKVRTPLEPIDGEGHEGGYAETFVRRPIWDQWAKSDGEVPHCYGEMWRRWPFDVGDLAAGHWDQVDRAVADLRTVQADPAARARRRIIITGWNPPLVPQMGLPPCHTLAQFLPTNGHLDCVCHWRSIDTFTGMPFNIAQYALLTTLLAQAAGLVPRCLVANIADCHVYDNQFDQIDDQLTREPLPPPSLVIDPAVAEAAPDLTAHQIRGVDPGWFRLDGYRCHKGRPGGVLPEIAI